MGGHPVHEASEIDDSANHQPPGGVTADSHADKAAMLMEISFPSPTPYDGDEGEEGPPGVAYLAVDERLVADAFRGTNKKKGPGPDGIGPLAISCVHGWDPRRITALIRAHIRLGVHLDRWKVARGVTIPKPGKDDYSLAKSYHCISLLNCLGKMVEKVAAELVGAHYDRVQGVHPGQYGCRKGRSAVDAVGITIAQA